MNMFYKIFGLIFFNLFFLNNTTFSQNCSYTVTNNYSVVADTGIVYKTIIYYDVKTLKYDTIDLKMDIIKPIGDNNPMRPIVFYFHGMNESYKATDSHVARMVNVMVKERGFVLASVDYKIWAYPYVEVNPTSCGNLLLMLIGVAAPYDTIEPKRAVYRCVQDANDAIKYVKARNMIDSSCVNLSFLSGFSAGGLIATSTAFLSQNEKPSAAFNTSPANYTNIFGTALNPTVSVSRSDLGSCSGNLNNGFNTNVKGVTIFNSGIQSINYISTNDPPMYIYHSNNDPNIVADSSSPACFTDAKMYGQNAIKNRALSQGYILNTNLFLANDLTTHDFFETQIRPAADFISNQININQCQCDTNTALNVFQNIENLDIKIYANNNKIYINSTSIKDISFEVVLYDVLGNKVFFNTFQNSDKYEINTNLRSGVYVIYLNGNGIFLKKKIFITSNY